MALIKKPWTFRLGTKADPDQVNANFDALFTEVNGKLDDNNIAPITASQDDNTAGSAVLTGKLSQIASRLFTRLRMIQGTTNVWDAPPISLKETRTQIDSLTKERFTITGNCKDETVEPNVYEVFFSIPVSIPVNKKLYLSSASFALTSFNLRLAVKIGGVVKWTSTDSYINSSAMKILLSDSNPATTVEICGTSTQTGQAFTYDTGYMLVFTIE